jgi:lipopolysaccharide transport protein LptA
LTEPEAQTFNNEKLLTLTAQQGKFNQSTQVLDLSENVIADYDKQMKVTSNSATYNFSTEQGFGNEKVVGRGEKGYFEADRFTFDKKKSEITLLHNVYLKSGDIVLRSPDKATLYSTENKFISTNATLIQNKDTLKGDTLTIYFKDTKHFEIDKAFSNGHTAVTSGEKTAFADRGEYDAKSGLIKLFDNVKITDKSGYVATSKIGVYDDTKKTFTLEENVQIKKGTSLIKAPKAIYFQNAGEFRFYGRVFISQEDGTATADSGVYFIKKNIAELEHNVILEKNGNTVHGDKAIADLNTSKSRLIAKEGGRISGKLFESTLKQKKD